MADEHWDKELLIHLVQARPSLYKFTSNGYKDQIKGDNCWKDIANELSPTPFNNEWELKEKGMLQFNANCYHSQSHDYFFCQIRLNAIYVFQSNNWPKIGYQCNLVP